MGLTLPRLLLLDLDGVVVLECGPPTLPGLEILRLHPELPGALARLVMPVVVCTHRSRREARRILMAAGIETGSLDGIMAAEDIGLSALRHAGPLRLLAGGLRKSFVLPQIERRFGIDRRDIVLVDDRLDNLEDMLEAGLGLALHAPSGLTAEACIVTFDFAEVEAVLASGAHQPRSRAVALAPVEVEIDVWRRTGLSAEREGRHAFNALRNVARRVRQSAQAART